MANWRLAIGDGSRLGSGSGGSRGDDHGLHRYAGFLIGVRERAGHRMAARRGIKLEEDALDTGRQEILADGSRRGGAALYAGAAFKAQSGAGLRPVFGN